jgi:hypothetical protein
MTDKEIEQYIKDVLEKNYTLLKTVAGHGLTEDVKNNALQQVLYYFQKCGDIARKVTDTEVKLTLSNLTTSSEEKRPFAIEGVVDIVSEKDNTWMYDLKTDSLDHIESNMNRYEAQLNVYAYIYQELQKKELKGTAIISTVLPIELQDAIADGDTEKIDRLLVKWQPIKEIKNFSQENVKATIREFGETVDKIETNQFSPPSVERLGEKLGKVPDGTKGRKRDYRRTFARRTCANCDARYSCASYKAYQKSIAKKEDFKDRGYYDVYDNNAEREMALSVNTDLSVLGDVLDLKDLQTDGSS